IIFRPVEVECLNIIIAADSSLAFWNNRIALNIRPGFVLNEIFTDGNDEYAFPILRHSEVFTVQNFEVYSVSYLVQRLHNRIYRLSFVVSNESFHVLSHDDFRLFFFGYTSHIEE